MPNAMNILDALKASDIPFEINTFVDGLYDVRLGDYENGIVARKWCNTFAEVESFLAESARRWYPESEFAKGGTHA